VGISFIVKRNYCKYKNGLGNAHPVFCSTFLGDSLRWQRDTLYPLKLALTSPTSGGRSIGIVRLRTKATEFVYLFVVVYVRRLNVCFPLQRLVFNARWFHVTFMTDLNYYGLFSEFMPYSPANHHSTIAPYTFANPFPRIGQRSFAFSGLYVRDFIYD
jgi:hypothetical protein